MTHRVQKKPRARKKQVRRVTKGHKRKRKRLAKTAKTKVVSQRGREHPMAAPGISLKYPGQQNVFMESTVIDKFSYDSKSRKLIILFQSGHVYSYYDVPEYTIELLRKAPSKGHFFYYNIRTSFTFRRVI
jgi:lysyl-tRNA synthetase class 2